jgi:hypothetical protein
MPIYPYNDSRHSRYASGVSGWVPLPSEGFPGTKIDIPRYYRLMPNGESIYFKNGLWYDKDGNIVAEEIVLELPPPAEKIQRTVENCEKEEKQRRTIECQVKKEASHQRWSRPLLYSAFVFLLGCLLFGFLVRTIP